MDTLRIEDAADYERAKEIIYLAQVIADQTKNETVKALAAMLSATAEEIINAITSTKSPQTS